MIIWKTDHPINETVTKALAKGTRFQRKNVDRFEQEFRYNPKESIGYGILRGMTPIYQFCESNNLDYYNIDKGFLKPSHFNGYYRIGKNGLQPTYRDIDLSEDRLKRLKIDMNEWQPKDDGYILVCPPTVYMENYYNWAHDAWLGAVEAWASNFTDRSLLVRKKSEADVPLRHQMAKAYCMITFNSNAGIEALLAGIPVIAQEGASVIHGWNNLEINDIKYPEKLISHDREKLFRYLSYCQFTLREFETGEAWKITQEVQG